MGRKPIYGPERTSDYPVNFKEEHWRKENLYRLRKFHSCKITDICRRRVRVNPELVASRAIDFAKSRFTEQIRPHVSDLDWLRVEPILRNAALWAMQDALEEIQRQFDDGPEVPELSEPQRVFEMEFGEYGVNGTLYTAPAVWMAYRLSGREVPWMEEDYEDALLSGKDYSYDKMRN